MTHIMYFDRDPGKKYGRLTLQRVGRDGKPVVLFEKLPVATGQFPFLDGGPDDWVVGKGGTPFGTHWLSTKKEPLTSAEPYGTPFYPISTRKGLRMIEGPDGKHRTHIGLHLENDKPGSAGCPALLWDTPGQECLAWAMFAYLDRLHKYEQYIRFIVL